MESLAAQLAPDNKPVAMLTLPCVVSIAREGHTAKLTAPGSRGHGNLEASCVSEWGFRMCSEGHNRLPRLASFEGEPGASAGRAMHSRGRSVERMV
mmetsp:Transcript_31070/g.78242  ORF Transcript_31070/g.78242 Transcript_31070/m.78242 type:complete len:96 (-) Transcript_31070:24-311(-)